MEAKLLSFIFSYFSESGLFNELHAIKIEKIPLPCLEVAYNLRPAPGLALRL